MRERNERSAPTPFAHKDVATDADGPPQVALYSAILDGKDSIRCPHASPSFGATDPIASARVDETLRAPGGTGADTLG